MIRTLTLALSLLTGWPLLDAPAAPLVERIFCVDYRPATKLIVVRTFAKLENCQKLNNPGCLQNKHGKYAKFPSRKAGMDALIHWVERHEHMTIADMVRLYNAPGGAAYLRRFLEVSQLNSDLVIAEEIECQ